MSIIFLSYFCTNYNTQHYGKQTDHGYNNKNNFGEETFLDKFRYNRLFLFIISKCLFCKI